MPSRRQPQPAWVSLRAAADFLSLEPGSLRRTFERRAKRVPDGGVEAELDGVVARKFGRLWRVRFSDSWVSEREGSR